MKLSFVPTCAVELRITVNYEVGVVPGVRDNLYIYLFYAVERDIPINFIMYEHLK